MILCKNESRVESRRVTSRDGTKMRPEKNQVNYEKTITLACANTNNNIYKTLRPTQDDRARAYDKSVRDFIFMTT